MPRQAGLDAIETYITLLSEKQKSAGLLMIDWIETQPHTLSPELWALLRGVRLPGDWALYSISVRRLIALHSGFLQTTPREIALAFS